MSIKKSELDSMTDAEKQAKVEELKRAILELRGEGRNDKVKSLRKSIARLKTPRPKKVKKK
ncbi:50S ribosomal protein L29 [Candidatus Micrarchaeota archaeon]|nr:50S ribosomal protein L29 [Candidatus Micrarchaeota archaeon]